MEQQVEDFRGCLGDFQEACQLYAAHPGSPQCIKSVEKTSDAMSEAVDAMVAGSGRYLQLIYTADISDTAYSLRAMHPEDAPTLRARFLSQSAKLMLSFAFKGHRQQHTADGSKPPYPTPPPPPPPPAHAHAHIHAHPTIGFLPPLQPDAPKGYAHSVSLQA